MWVRALRQCRSRLWTPSCAGFGTTGTPTGLALPGLAAMVMVSHQWQDRAAEILDLFLEVQKAAEHEIGPGLIQGDDALGDLLRRADELRPKAVVVLDKVAEARLCPIALSLRRGLSGVLGLVAKGLDCFKVGLGGDLVDDGAGYASRRGR